jgi:8-oxo-dGTP pyrophosphatase MutT (NUDIX family)
VTPAPPPAPAPAPPAIPRAAASVLLVRAGGRSGVQVYMVRRAKDMRFLGGWYAFPGGKVDPGDGAPEMLGRCRGLAPEDAARVLPALEGIPPIAFCVTAARELLEETGVLMACDDSGRAVSMADPAVAARAEEMRRALMAGDAPLAELLVRAGFCLDLGPLRYLSHFITPPSSPIRFTARFFLAPVPDGQAPRLFTEETSEGFWIDPPEGVERHEAGEMPMAEPASAALRYLVGFTGIDALWTAHDDRRHKFHGIDDRLIAAGAKLKPRPGARPAS